MPEKLVEISNLTVLRNGRGVLKDLNLNIERGTPYALVGESGSGKTTLLYTLLGLLPATQGTARIKGNSLTSLGHRARAQLMGLVFQDYQLFPHLTVVENIELAPKRLGIPVTREAIHQLLQELKLNDLGERYPHELSGGQKQRVAIARSLVMGPEVLFFDEPSSALDSKTTRELATLLLRLNEKSQVIIVSHDTIFLELVCSRGAVLRQGKIAHEGSLKASL